MLIPAYSIQREPDHYPEPDRFDPQRFDKEQVAKRHNCAWLPFGEGPRTCIGLRFGMMSSKVGLVSLLRSFRFAPNDRTEVPLVINKFNFILSPQNGIHLKIEKLLE